MTRSLVRVTRIGLVLAAAALFWVAQQRVRSTELGALVSLNEAQRVFPAASRLGPADPQRRWHPVFNAAGAALGVVLRTAPETDHLIGYAGPSDLVIGLGTDGRVVGVALLQSADTPAHVEEVRRASSFWQTWTGWSPTETPPRVAAVSGSTLTSLAMAEGVEQRLTGRMLSQRFPRPLALDEVRTVYPEAANIVTDQPRVGWTAVKRADGNLLGYVVRTAPVAENVIGYRGPSEALLAVSADEQRITAVRLRDSYDTPEYVDRVREDHAALEQLAGRTWTEWAALDFRQAGIEGVSGATQTSYALAEGIRQRARHELAPPTGRSAIRFGLRDRLLIGLTLGALVLGFSHWRGDLRARRIWQIVLVAGFGLWCGDLLSLGLLAGWSRNGPPWATAPGLLVLVAAALLTPAVAGRNVYCHYLCPHGAVQEWIGRRKFVTVSLPARVSRGLGRLPAALLIAAGLWALADATFDLALVEPFDAWGLKGRWSIPLGLALVGLGASCCVPMAYCRFGCPTGALLKFLVTSRDARFSRRDALAASILLVAAGVVFRGDLAARFSPANQSAPANPAQTNPVLHGEAFGTTWSVTFRQLPSDAVALQQRLSDRLEAIEATLSHWRPQSETSQFNASETTFEIDASPALMELLRFGDRLRTATHGAFDLTVAPLVDLWGYGPSRRSTPPTEAELAAALSHVGGDKLVLSAEFNALSKTDPAVRIDLGALLQGSAVDQLALVLQEAGVAEFLINVGGELRAQGSWTVAIEDPRDPTRPLETITLTDAALATSGIYRRGRDGSTQTRHILSPRTGQPVEPYWQLCAVQAPTALAADGWATALLAVASEESLAIAERAGLVAWCVDRDGRMQRVGPVRPGPGRDLRETER